MKEIEIVKKMIEENQFEADVFLSILRSFGEDIALIPLLLLKRQKIIRSRINDKKRSFLRSLGFVISSITLCNSYRPSFPERTPYVLCVCVYKGC